MKSNSDNPNQFQRGGESQPNVQTVSQLTNAIKSRLADEFASVWVGGELSGVTKATSGHVYLTLKDASASLSGIIWRTTASAVKFDLKPGLEVVCQGYIDVYPQRGSYQLIIRQIQPVGVGELELAFRQLHAKLKTEGLFDDTNKKPLPPYPGHIAVVTSPTGAAVRDFLQVMTRRWPNIRVTIVPAKVQGPGSAEQIARGISACGRFADRPDIVVVTRGGGSIEDLWSFNEEIVVRAIHACPIPVISGVGHEIDVTLSDLVADVRALTPSEAAERAVADRADLLASLQHVQRGMHANLVARFQSAEQQLNALSSRPAIARPLERLRHAGMELDSLETGLHRSSKQLVSNAEQAIAHAASKLESLNPLAVLARGYSVTTDQQGQTISDCQQVSPGDKIVTRLANGEIVSRVQ